MSFCTAAGVPAGHGAGGTHPAGTVPASYRPLTSPKEFPTDIAGHSLGAYPRGRARQAGGAGSALLARGTGGQIMRSNRLSTGNPGAGRWGALAALLLTVLPGAAALGKAPVPGPTNAITWDPTVIRKAKGCGDWAPTRRRTETSTRPTATAGVSPHTLTPKRSMGLGADHRLHRRRATGGSPTSTQGKGRRARHQPSAAPRAASTRSATARTA